MLWQKFYGFKIFTTSRSVNSVLWGKVSVKQNVRMLWLFSTSETGDWTEFTFAKTFGTVTRDREKNWPIADWYVTRNDPTNNCGAHFGTSSLFVFRSLSGELGSLCIDVVLCQWIPCGLYFITRARRTLKRKKKGLWGGYVLGDYICNMNLHVIVIKLGTYRAFSLTWPASVQIHWNQRKRLYSKRVQFPQDCLGLPFHCFGTPIWPPWCHVKTRL